MKKYELLFDTNKILIPVDPGDENAMVTYYFKIFFFGVLRLVHDRVHMVRYKYTTKNHCTYKIAAVGKCRMMT